MAGSVKYSEESPAKLMRKLSFWSDQKVFLLCIALFFVLLLFFWPYTYGQKDLMTWVFNLIIHSLGILGMLSGAKFLAETEANYAVVKYIEDKEEQYSKDIKANADNRIDLDTLKREILPNNKSNLAMMRLFIRIIEEAKDRRFESSISVVQPYQDESYEKILEISNFQKIALRLGILGTFIGLIDMIKELATPNESVNEDVMKLIVNLFKPLYIAFSTSVAGLQVAIFLVDCG